MEPADFTMATQCQVHILVKGPISQGVRLVDFQRAIIKRIADRSYKPHCLLNYPRYNADWQSAGLTLYQS